MFISININDKLNSTQILISVFRQPDIIDFSYHIANIKLKNHLANTGIALIQQAASKTNDIAGDGTTTATVLAHAMLKQGMKKKEIV